MEGRGADMQKITPFLWFDGQAEEAARFYASVFKKSDVGEVTHYPETGTEVTGQPPGSTMTVPFELAGMQFVGLNGGPDFKFSEAISFVVNCDTQEEIDYFWEQLTQGGGAESECGWLKDKFGLSWQIYPPVLGEMLQDKDPSKSGRVMEAMLKMKKLDIRTLKAAYENKAA
jgi:predicted 3-demethylubiquinone-9 3-methyltransferase (glyoxalase superfamily)